MTSHDIERNIACLALLLFLLLLLLLLLLLALPSLLLLALLLLLLLLSSREGQHLVAGLQPSGKPGRSLAEEAPRASY